MKDAMHVGVERVGLLAVGQPVRIWFRDGSSVRCRIESWDEQGLTGTDLRAAFRQVHPRWADMVQIDQIG